MAKHRGGIGPYAAFGAWLKACRLEANIRSQPEAARKAQRLRLSGITQGKLSYIERGWNENADPMLLRAVAKLYPQPYETVVAKWAEHRCGTDLGSVAPALEDFLDKNERQYLKRFRDLTDHDKAWFVDTLERAERRGEASSTTSFSWDRTERRKAERRQAGQVAR